MEKFLSRFENILFWLLIATVGFVILYPKLPLESVQNTFVSIRLEDFVIFGMVLLWGIYIIVSGKFKKLLSEKIIQAIVIFLFIGALSTLSGIFLTKTTLPHLGALHFLRRVELMVFLPMALTLVKKTKQMKIILSILSVIIFIVALYALGQEYLHFPIISTTTSDLSTGKVVYVDAWTAVNSTFAGHYDLAVFLLMSLAILSAMFFYLRKIVLQVGIVILGGLSFFVLILTAARQSFAAAIVGVIVSLFLSGKKLLILAIIVITALALVYPSHLRDRLVSTLTVSFFDDGQAYKPLTEQQQQASQLNIPTLQVKSQLIPVASGGGYTTPSAGIAPDIVPGEPTNTTDLGVYRSFAIRFNVEWPRALNALYKNPVLGTGYSSLGLATDNDFLRSLGEVGILGTIAFILVIVLIWKMIWQQYKSTDKLVKYFSAGVLAMIVAFLLNGVFIDVFESSKIAILFWFLIGINMAVGR